MSRLPVLATAAVLAALLAACGSSSSSPRLSTEGEGPTSIRLTLFGDPVETAGYQTMVDEFMETNPDVTVTLAPVAKQDDLLAKLTTEFAAGDPPDVFLVNFRKYGQFASEGVLAPVQPYLDESTEISAEEFTQTSFDAFRFDGEELTCMPQNLSSLVVYYNEDLFADAGQEVPQPGWTWTDFLAVAEALTVPSQDVYGLGVEPSLIRVAPFVWSNGGEVVDDQVAPTRLDLDEPDAREALDFFLDLQLQHGVVPDDAAEQAQESEARFLDGRLAMYMNSRRSVPTLRTIEDFTWDVAPVPVAPGGEPVTMLHADAYCLAADGEADAAWRLVEFAMGERGQEILAETGRTVPSRLDVQAGEAFLDPSRPPEHAEVFVENGDIVRATPHTASWSRVEKQADSVLEDIFYGRIPREEGLELLQSTTTPLFGGG